MFYEVISCHSYYFQNLWPSQHCVLRNPLNVYDFKSMNILIFAIFYLDEWYNYIPYYGNCFFTLDSYQHPINDVFQVMM